MADNVAVTAGAGTTIATDDVSSVHYQRVKVVWGTDGVATDANASTPLPVVQTGSLPAGTAAIGKLAANSGVDIGDVDVTSVPADPFGVNADAASATGSISAKLRFIASTGIPITGTVTVGSHAVTVASGGIASGAVASGAIASGAVASGAFASGSIAAGAVAAGATSFVHLEDDASANLDAGVGVLAVRKSTPADTSGADGDYEFIQMSGGRVWVDPSGVTLTVASHAVTNAGTFAVQDATAQASLSVLDDWDESDRAKVNLIVGQAGIAAGAGTVGVTVPRVTLASDDPAVASLSVLDDWDETNRCAVNPISGQVGVAAGSGTVSALTQRVVLATDVALPTGTNSIGAVTNTYLTQFGVGSYETVAASQTAQVLGSTGATGDYIASVLVIPATTSPGNVILLDNAISITIFTGGASSVSNLVPFSIPLGMVSVSGALKLTTGANVSCVAVGKFT